MDTNSGSRPATSEVRWSIIYSLGWFACALVALGLTQGEDGIAAVWPSSGIFVAALLHLGPQGRKLTSIGVALASLAANMWSGAAPFAAIGYTFANLIEGWLVFLLMDRARFRHMLLAKPSNLVRFTFSAAAAGIASSIMAAALSGNFGVTFVTSWMSTVTLGMLTVTPVIMFILQDRRHGNRILSFRGFWTFMLVTLSALVAFGQAEVPLLFLPMVAISITTATLGLSGAVIALLLVTTIGSVLTALGMGPVRLFFPPVEGQVVFFQVYLLALLVSTLPVALSLSQHRRNLEEIATSKKLLEAAERAAKVGHWRHNPERDTIFWSEEAGRLLSRMPLPVSLSEMVDMFHKDDRQRVAGLMKTAQSTGIPFAFEARIDRFDGSAAYFECRNEVHFDQENGQPAIFGTIMDVTERAETMHELERARQRAEFEAAEVRVLAETDHLTGLANRRKIFARLTELMATAEEGREPVTIAILDLDHFKTINDQFGHEVGDQTLLKVSETLADALDANGLLGRIGGEEFLAIFPGQDAHSVLERCLTLGSSLEACELPKEIEGAVTASVGIAQYAKGWDEKRFLRAADEALYSAKRGGRARCAVYGKSETA